MTDSDLIHFENVGGRHPVFPEEKRRKFTAISARIGVWGVITGLGSIAVGFLAPGAALGLAGVGFLAGGLGAIATSVLVARDLRKASWPLKLAAFVGAPFGACLVAFAGGTLLGWPFLQIPLVAWAVPVGAVLGVTLMILLLTGFLTHALSRPDSGWED